MLLQRAPKLLARLRVASLLLVRSVLDPDRVDGRKREGSVHTMVSAPILSRSRSVARVRIWLTRDSVTLSTCPISFKNSRSW